MQNCEDDSLKIKFPDKMRTDFLNIIKIINGKSKKEVLRIF